MLSHKVRPNMHDIHENRSESAIYADYMQRWQPESALRDVQWGILAGIGYVFVVLFFLAGFTIGHAEHNRNELQRIVRGE